MALVMLSGVFNRSLYSAPGSCSRRSLGVGVGDGESSPLGGERRRLRGDRLRGAVEVK